MSGGGKGARAHGGPAQEQCGLRSTVVNQALQWLRGSATPPSIAMSVRWVQRKQAPPQ